MNYYSMKGMESYLGVSMARQKDVAGDFEKYGSKIPYQKDKIRDTGKTLIGYKYKDFWKLVKSSFPKLKLIIRIGQ